MLEGFGRVICCLAYAAALAVKTEQRKPISHLMLYVKAKRRNCVRIGFVVKLEEFK